MFDQSITPPGRSPFTVVSSSRQQQKIEITISGSARHAHLYPRPAYITGICRHRQAARLNAVTYLQFSHFMYQHLYDYTPVAYDKSDDHRRPGRRPPAARQQVSRRRWAGVVIDHRPNIPADARPTTAYDVRYMYDVRYYAIYSSPTCTERCTMKNHFISAGRDLDVA